MPLITKKVAFTASHYYWYAGWNGEENKARFRECSNRNGHGHNYQVEVTLEGEISSATGMIINFSDLTPLLNRGIVEPLDHRNLNLEVPYFQDKNPTLENITLYIWKALFSQGYGENIKLSHLKVMENEDIYAEYDGNEQDMPTLTRRYTFSAAHKLWNLAMTDEQNKACFGKCTHLHGHNYILDVTVSGSLDPQTGMITDIVLLDKIIQERILLFVDHQYLDEDLPWLAGKTSTVENLVQIIFDQLVSEVSSPAFLDRVRLVETENNWAECSTPEVLKSRV